MVNCFYDPSVTFASNLMMNSNDWAVMHNWAWMVYNRWWGWVMCVRNWCRVDNWYYSFDNRSGHDMGGVYGMSDMDLSSMMSYMDLSSMISYMDWGYMMSNWNNSFDNGRWKDMGGVYGMSDMNWSYMMSYMNWCYMMRYDWSGNNFSYWGWMMNNMSGKCKTRFMMERTKCNVTLTMKYG